MMAAQESAAITILGIKELYSVQWISRTFKDTIAGSKKLQCAMWLLQEDSDEDATLVRNTLLTRCKLPLLRRANFGFIELSERRIFAGLYYDPGMAPHRSTYDELVATRAASWRHTLIASRPGVLDLHLWLVEDERFSGCGPAPYSGWTGIEGVRTLGDIADRMEGELRKFDAEYEAIRPRQEDRGSCDYACTTQRGMSCGYGEEGDELRMGGSS